MVLPVVIIVSNLIQCGTKIIKKLAGRGL